MHLHFRSLRYGHSIRSHAHNTKNAAPSELPLPQTSTLRSRRRLARLLVAGSFVFVFCWSPHVIFLICTKWSARHAFSKTAANYSLLLGKFFISTKHREKKTICILIKITLTPPNTN